MAQLPRRTKHIPRRQKVRSVDSSRTGSDGSGPAALLRAFGASGMTSRSPFHFLNCASIECCKHTVPEREAATLCHAQLSVIVWTSNFTLKGETKKVCQNTSVGLPCPLPSQLLSCSVIFPVHCTVSSLALFLKSIFFSWQEGQVKRSSIRFVWPTIAASSAR